MKYHVNAYRSTKDITMELRNGFASTVMSLTILLVVALSHCNGKSMSLGKGRYMFINLLVSNTPASLFKFAK